MSLSARYRASQSTVLQVPWYARSLEGILFTKLEGMGNVDAYNLRQSRILAHHPKSWRLTDCGIVVESWRYRLPRILPEQVCRTRVLV